MSKWCCAECFGDRGLREDIVPAISSKVGVCDYCDSEDVALVEPRDLADYFELLISIYEPSEGGETLVELMKRDWELFSHEKMDVAHAKEILSDILDDGEVVRRRFVASSDYESEGLARWETLRHELLNKNRYFLDEELDEDRLEQLLPYLIANDIPDTWYRARIMEDDEPYVPEKMGAPPNNLASHGRANPVGIPYLYVGSHINTAISEVRPHPGEKVCVARFDVPSGLKVIDLRNPRKLVSPFLLGEASAIGQLRADIPFLERLGDELTRPVLPRSAAIDYIPSQYLCEFIKKIGYMGVAYRSSHNEGINLAIFYPHIATANEVSVHAITKVDVSSEMEG